MLLAALLWQPTGIQNVRSHLNARGAHYLRSAMATSAAKVVDFASWPLMGPGGQWLPTSALGGIGPRAEAALQRQGVSYAYQLVGQYLVFGFDEDRTRGWLSELFDREQLQISAGHMDCAIRSLRSWCERWLQRKTQ